MSVFKNLLLLLHILLSLNIYIYTPINIFSKISKGDEISPFVQPVIHSSFHLARSLQLQIKLFSLTNPEKYCYQTTEYVKYHGLYYDKISSKINAAYLSIFISTLLNLYFLCKF